MKVLAFKDFDKVYKDSVLQIYKQWTPQMQTDIARHCHGWRPGKFDFRTYLEASSVRFYKAYCAFAEGNCSSVCDVGGFWGVFPLTLKRLGYDVTMTEALKYFSDSFNGLFEHITSNGVKIVDYDPFGTDLPPLGGFDAITIMAVLEHYPHSLKAFMKNIDFMLGPKGMLYIEVPNIAYWPKRVNLFLGRTPLTPLEDIFLSEVPFIGHHHEFTISELRDLLRLSGLRAVSEEFYNYSPDIGPSSSMLFRHPLMFLAFLLIPDSRECLAVLCKKDENG